MPLFTHTRWTVLSFFRRVSLLPAVFVLLWSSGAIFSKLGLNDAEPLTFLSWRLALAAAILWLVCGYLRTPLPADRREWLRILVTGWLMQAGYPIFFFLALAHDLSPGLLTLILGAQPILTAVTVRERIRAQQWAGLLLGILGLALVVGNSWFIGSFSPLGIGSALLSLVCITAGTLLQKRITLNLPANTAIQLTGSVWVVFILAIGLEKGSIRWTASFGISLAWMTLVISVGATLLLFFLIRRGNVTNVTSLFYCVPPTTALLDYWIFGNVLHPASLLGMVCIVKGLILVNRRGRMV